MVSVQPERQMVEPMVVCVTARLSAPGVSSGSGSPGRRAAGTEGVGGGSPLGPGVKAGFGSSLPDGSSPGSFASVAEGRADAAGVATGGVTVAEAAGVGESVAATTGVAEDEPQPASRSARRTRTTDQLGLLASPPCPATAIPLDNAIASRPRRRRRPDSRMRTATRPEHRRSWALESEHAELGGGRPQSGSRRPHRGTAATVLVGYDPPVNRRALRPRPGRRIGTLGALDPTACQ